MRRNEVVLVVCEPPVSGEKTNSYIERYNIGRVAYT